MISQSIMRGFWKWWVEGRKERSNAPKLRTRPLRRCEGRWCRRCRAVRRERWPPADWRLCQYLGAVRRA